MNPELTAPLRNSYVVPGTRLIAGEYPGGRMEEESLDKLQRLLMVGVDTFIDLTTSDDHLQPYEHLLRTFDPDGRVRYENHPVPDMDVPDEGTLTRILDAIAGALDEGRTVYVHCWGGVGRTGTVVGCWLARGGQSGDDALATVARLFATMAKAPSFPEGSPQTPAQRDLVRRHAESRS